MPLRREVDLGPGDIVDGDQPPIPPNGIGQAIIFSCLGFFNLSFFFPRLISAVGDWMSTILLHMVWS